MEAVWALGATPRGGRLQAPLLGGPASEQGAFSLCSLRRRHQGGGASPRSSGRARVCTASLPHVPPPLGIFQSASSCRAPLCQCLCCLQTSGNHGCPPLCDAKQLSCPQLPRALSPAGPGSQKTPAGLVIRTGHLQRDFTRRVLAGTDGALCWGDLRRI